VPRPGWRAIKPLCMADPKKETKRERREVAKQRRLEEIRRRQRKARMRRLITIGVVALAVIGLVGGIIFARVASNRNKANLAKIAKEGGCEPIKTLSSEGASHVDPPATVKYKTNPPTSGNHYGATANTGILSPAPPDENLVHNMEHGQVIFWYKPDLDPSIITALQNIVKKDPTRLILVPRSQMEPKLALTSWAHLQNCPNPTSSTPAVAQNFADERKAKGPEGTGDSPGVPAGV
jgi:hypothetical protein